MNISKNCLDLVALFEGLRLEAYIDPVGIPTIGYGTIRYPDGAKVQLGDKISEIDAESMLKLEADEIAEAVSALIDSGVTLNQNQFDALVSFCYNVGPGAFEGSTLRKKLNRSDFVGAAAEFNCWDKGTVNGVKQVLSGLTRRRKYERMLFEKTTDHAEPIGAEKSPQQKVRLLQGFRDGNRHLIVARDEDDQVVEIVSMANNDIDHLSDLVSQYPKASRFEIAEPGTPISAGERIEFAVRDRLIPKYTNPPSLNRILKKGCENGEGVKVMQQQLPDLGYYSGPIDGNFGRGTDGAVKDFQARVFGTAEADGKVGPRTWKSLFSTRATFGNEVWDRSRSTSIISSRARRNVHLSRFTWTGIANTAPAPPAVSASIPW